LLVHGWRLLPRREGRGGAALARTHYPHRREALHRLCGITPRGSVVVWQHLRFAAAPILGLRKLPAVVAPPAAAYNAAAKTVTTPRHYHIELQTSQLYVRRRNLLIFCLRWIPILRTLPLLRALLPRTYRYSDVITLHSNLPSCCVTRHRGLAGVYTGTRRSRTHLWFVTRALSFLASCLHSTVSFNAASSVPAWEGQWPTACLPAYSTPTPPGSSLPPILRTT